MSDSRDDSRPNVFPFLRYDDAPAAIEWLVRVFGFERHEVYPGPEGTIAHAQLRLGAGLVMLGSARDDELGMKSARHLPAVNQGIYVRVDDVDDHHHRAREAGAELVYPLRDTDYGSREYGARDLEGNLWTFGTYDPYAS